MAATVEIDIYTAAAAGTRASAEAGFKFGRDDLQTSTAAIPIPTATGTAFSWHKSLALYVTAGGGSTSLSNRKVYSNGAHTAGLAEWWTAYTTDTYFQAAAVASADSGSNGSTPAQGSYGATWTAMPTAVGSASTYDSASVAATNATKNGKYLVLCLGVANNYAGGGNAATALQDLKISYDES